MLSSKRSREKIILFKKIVNISFLSSERDEKLVIVSLVKDVKRDASSKKRERQSVMRDEFSLWKALVKKSRVFGLRMRDRKVLVIDSLGNSEGKKQDEALFLSRGNSEFLVPEDWEVKQLWLLSDGRYWGRGKNCFKNYFWRCKTIPKQSWVVKPLSNKF